MMEKPEFPTDPDHQQREADQFYGQLLFGLATLVLLPVPAWIWWEIS